MRFDIEKWLDDHTDDTLLDAQRDHACGVHPDDVRKLYEELTRWGPVTERLPEYGEVVRVWNSDGERIGHVERMTPQNGAAYDRWWSDCMDSCGCCDSWDNDVQAWMPLGKPYEPAKGGE